jgi:predicted nucleic acid-binding protein
LGKESNGWAFLQLLDALAVEVDDETESRAWSDVVHLARAHTLSAYDAAYLELAMRRGLPLAILDRGLRTAAAAVGVTVYRT